MEPTVKASANNQLMRVAGISLLVGLFVIVIVLVVRGRFPLVGIADIDTTNPANAEASLNKFFGDSLKAAGKDDDSIYTPLFTTVANAAVGKNIKITSTTKSESLNLVSEYAGVVDRQNNKLVSKGEATVKIKFNALEEATFTIELVQLGSDTYANISKVSENLPKEFELATIAKGKWLKLAESDAQNVLRITSLDLNTKVSDLGDKNEVIAEFEKTPPFSDTKSAGAVVVDGANLNCITSNFKLSGTSTTVPVVKLCKQSNSSSPMVLELTNSLDSITVSQSVTVGSSIQINTINAPENAIDLANIYK